MSIGDKKWQKYTGEGIKYIIPNFKIQPVEFTAKNRLSFLQGCVIKRICRFNLPGGKGKVDLEKIKHEIDLIIELEDF